MGSETLTPAQTAQMERDLARLMPDGPPKGTRLSSHAAQKTSPDGVHSMFTEPTVVKPRSIWHWRRYPMGGWVYWQVPARMQRTDQGQDGEVPMGRHVIAPGWGKCVHHLSDGEFPNGFGSPYAVVYIGSGRFAGKLMYLGHCNAQVIPAGVTFHTGRVLAAPNHSLNSGWGWFEIGHAPNGYPGPMGEGARLHSLFSPLWRWTTA